MSLMTSNIEAPSTNFAERVDSPDSAAPFRLGKASVLGLIGTMAVVIGALLGGQNFETHLPGAWFFGMPGGFLGSIGSNNVYPPALAMICVFGGLILLTRVWLSLMRQLKARPGFPVRKVVLVVAIWALPLLMAPPLFSRDVYSYAGQGEMVSHHINPYDYGTGVLGVTPFSTLPDITWTNTPTPYGPTFLTVDGALARLSGHEVLPDLLLLRLLEVASLALIMAALPTLARSMRRDPAETVLLGAGCPLVLMSLVGGAHNDALMIALAGSGTRPGPSSRDRPRDHPLRTGRGREVTRRARRPFSRLGMGRSRGQHLAAAGAHGGRRRDWPPHHGSHGRCVRHRMGLAEDVHRRRPILYGYDTG